MIRVIVIVIDKIYHLDIVKKPIVIGDYDINLFLFDMQSSGIKRFDELRNGNLTRVAHFK